MSKALQEALAAYGMSAADFREAFAACMDKDVTERPPKPGQSSHKALHAIAGVVSLLQDGAA